MSKVTIALVGCLLCQDIDHGFGYPVPFVERINNFSGGHALGVQIQDLVIHGCKAGLMLFDQLGFKAAISVSGRIQFERPVLGFYRLAGVTVSAVG